MDSGERLNTVEDYYERAISSVSNFSFSDEDETSRPKNTAIVKSVKNRVPYLKRISNLFRTYLKILMGRNTTEDEFEQLAMGLGEYPHKLRNQFKKTELLRRPDTGGVYLNEFDYHMGDIVLRLSVEFDLIVSRTLTTLILMQMYLLLWNQLSFVKAHFVEMLDNLITMKAIEQAYFMLDRRQQQRKKRKLHNKDTLISVEKSEEEEGGSNEDEEEHHDHITGRGHPHHHLSVHQETHQHAHLNKKALTDMARHSLIPQNFHHDKSPFKRSGAVNDPIDQAVMHLSNRLLGTERLDQRAKSQALKESMQVDYERLQKEKKRIMTRGFYLLHQKTDEDGTDDAPRRWVRSAYDTSDVMTLIRNIVMLQLTKQGFVTRSFISTDGATIYCVLYQNDDNLKLVAAKTMTPKKLNFQFSDLLSLEPIDGNLRPYRLSNRLWKVEEYSHEQVTPTFLYLRPKIIAILKEINFKLVAREMNLSQHNQSLLNYGVSDMMHDENGPSDEHWKAYYEYLLFMKDKILEARQQFYFDNDDALLINQQKTAYELYLKRNKEIKKELQDITEEELDLIYQGLYVSRSSATDRPRQHHLQQIAKIQEQYLKFQEKFKEVKSFLHINPHKDIGTKQIKVCKREKLASQYLEIFRDSLRVANYKRHLLLTIWDNIGVQPFEQYVPYVMSQPNQNFSQQSRLNAIWRKYNISETGKVSLFSMIERIKLTNACLQERINFNTLISAEYVRQVFCVNDQYELIGVSHKRFFNDLMKKKFSLDLLITQEQYLYLHKQVTQLIGSHDPPKDTLVKLQKNVYAQREFKFVEHKIHNLEFLWRFNYGCPWFVPTEAIREYYGEKIALYFTFLGYYTQMLLPIGLLGLGINLYQIYIWDNHSKYYVYPTMIFCMIQIQWVNLMFNLWQSNEFVFALKFGQLQSGSTESSAGKRAGFVGDYVRSVQNDQLNALSYQDWKKYGKVCLTILLQVLMLVAYGAVMVGLFFLAEKLDAIYSQSSGGVGVLGIGVTVPALLNVVLILMCDEVYDSVAEELTDFENHETIEDYESNYIFKKYFLSFLSVCGPLAEIMFIHPLVGLKCIQNDCYRHTQYHFSTIFLSLFTLNIWEIIKPKLTIFMRELKLKLATKKENKDSDNPEENDIQPSPIQPPPQRQDVGISQSDEDSMQLIHQHGVQMDGEFEVSSNPFKDINEYIEAESLKESYVITPERYGTVDDYMEITLQYSMLALFGVTFPMCYFIAFLWNVLELQTDKLKLLRYMQRPLPLGERSIGIWNGVLEILSYWSLLQNTGTLAYQQNRFEGEGFMGLNPLGFFLAALLTNFFLYFFESSFFGDKPYSIQALMKRQQYVLRSTVEKFRGSSTNGNVDDEDGGANQDKRYVIFKVYGCVESDDVRNALDADFDDMSSESDLEDNYVYNREDLRNMNQALKALKKKKKAYVESTEDLIARNSRRKSHWALKFKFDKPKDPIVQQRSKIFYEKTIRFLRQLELTTRYKKLWTDERMTERRFHLRRNKVLIRNLDWRRVMMLHEDQGRLKEKFTHRMKLKYQDKVAHLMLHPEQEQNQQDLQEIQSNTQKYIEKHTWLATRKVIVFRIKGVWFGQFRMSQGRQSPMTTLKNFRKLTKHLNRLERRGLYKAKPPTFEENLYNFMLSRTPTQLSRFSYKDFLEHMNKVVPPEKTFFTYQYSTRQPSLMEQQIDALKSVSLRRQCKFGAEFSYGHTFECEDTCMQLYWSELQRLGYMNGCNEFPDKPFHLLKLLDSKQHKQERKVSFDIYTKPDTFRWLITESKLDILIQPMNCDIFIYTEVTYSQIVYHDVLNRILRFNAQWAQIDKKNVLGLAIPTLKYLQFTLADSIDKIDDVICKGYLARVYSLQWGYYVLGNTLRDVIYARSRLDCQFSDTEVLDFIASTSKTLALLETRFKIFHGGLTPQSFYLIGGHFRKEEQTATYALLDIGMFCWYDPVSMITYFMRNFSEAGEEFWFSAPEINYNYLHPTQQKPLVPWKSDIYSLGLICLEMMTLGSMSQEVSQLATLGDVPRSVSTWIQQNHQQLELRYPLSFKFVQEMLVEGFNSRPAPSQIAQMFLVEDYKDTQVSIYLYPLSQTQESLDKLFNQYNCPKVVADRIVRIFGDHGSQLQFQKGSQISLSDYMKQGLHRINTLFRLKLMSKAIEQCDQLEKSLIDQFLNKVPYQEHTKSFIEQVEIYLTNRFNDIVQEHKHTKDMMRFFQYLLLKAQIMFANLEIQEVISYIRLFDELIAKLVYIIQNVFEQLEKGGSQHQSKMSSINLGTAFQRPEQVEENEIQEQQLFKLVYRNKPFQKIMKNLQFKFQSFGASATMILGHIYHLTMNFQTAQDIVDQVTADYLVLLYTEKKGFPKREVLDVNTDTDNSPLKKKVTIVGKETGHSVRTKTKLQIVTQGFVYRLCTFLRLKFLRLQIIFDRQRTHDYVYAYQNLHKELDTFGKMLLRRKVKNIDLSDTSLALIAGCDFFDLPTSLRLSLLNFIKETQMKMSQIQCKYDLNQFDLEHLKSTTKKLLRLKPSKCLFGMCQNMLVMKSLIEIALTTNNDALYIVLAEGICSQLSALYYQYQYQLKEKQTYIACIQNFYSYIIVSVGSLLQFASCNQLLEITSQALTIYDKSKTPLSRLAKLIILDLKLKAVQYEPVVYFYKGYKEDFIPLTQSTSKTSPISELKQLCISLPLLQKKSLVTRASSWSELDAAEIYIFWLGNKSLYYFSNLHSESVELDIDEKNFLYDLTEMLENYKNNTQKIHQNTFLDVTYAMWQFWSNFYMGEDTTDNLMIIKQQFEATLIGYFRSFTTYDNLQHYIQHSQSQFQYMIMLNMYLKGERWRDFIKSQIYTYTSTLPLARHSKFIIALLSFLQSVQQVEIGLYVTNLLDSFNNSDLVTEDCLDIVNERRIFSAIYADQDNIFSDSHRHSSKHPEYHLRYLKKPFFSIVAAKSTQLTEVEKAEIESILLNKHSIYHISLEFVQVTLVLIHQMLLSDDDPSLAIQYAMQIRQRLYYQALDYIKVQVKDYIEQSSFSQEQLLEVTMAHVSDVLKLNDQFPDILDNPDAFYILSEIGKIKEIKELLVFQSLYKKTQDLIKDGDEYLEDAQPKKQNKQGQHDIDFEYE